MWGAPRNLGALEGTAGNSFLLLPPGTLPLTALPAEGMPFPPAGLAPIRTGEDRTKAAGRWEPSEGAPARRGPGPPELVICGVERQTEISCKHNSKQEAPLTQGPSASGTGLGAPRVSSSQKPYPGCR